MTPNAKIRSENTARLAAIYIRQSTLQQVRENRASTEGQYALAERAVQLGWEKEKVRLYDGDLGVSGGVTG